MPHRPGRPLVCASVLTALVAGCASQSARTTPETGTVTVGVSTTGAAVRGLAFTVDISPGGHGGSIHADAGVFTARNVPAGEYTVSLTGVPERCRIDTPASRRITVSERRSATVRFTVSCR